ncbi:toluene-4-monooxygenase system B family protein [Pseudonocardia asaccharolytica]|nr:toluene-4-monooxygenase system B family protein [Pseudonocardia asaccharolytica]
MAPFPVQGITEGDFVVVLVPVDTEDPMTTVAEKIAHHAVNRRVPENDRPMVVRHNGRVLAADTTVVDAGVAPLDVLEVVHPS